MESIPDLVRAGSSMLVAGSSSLFKKDRTIKDNYRLMLEAAATGLANRKK